MSDSVKIAPVDGLLEDIALEVRKDVVRMIGLSRWGRIESSMSLVDVLVYLYWRYLYVNPENPRSPERDRFILGKGRGAPALYAVLARRGFFRRDELWSFRRLGAMLQSYPDVNRTPGIEAPGGSMGMGLGISVGLALAMELDSLPGRVVCLLGDGELQEGAVWEAVLSASARGLSRLVAVVEANEHDCGGKWSGIKAVEPISRKFSAFGWNVTDADGHDFASMNHAFSSLGTSRGDGPTAVLVRTRSGKGVSFAERHSAGGYDENMSRDEMDKALSELERVGGGNGDA